MNVRRFFQRLRGLLSRPAPPPPAPEQVAQPLPFRTMHLAGPGFAVVCGQPRGGFVYQTSDLKYVTCQKCKDMGARLAIRRIVSVR